VLGLLLSGVVGLFVGLALWQRGITDADLKLNVGQWLIAFSAVTAVVGWLTNAIVTVRNSVKQHTVSTLLQSRLSQPYMDRAKNVNAALSAGGGSTNSLTTEHIARKDPVVDDVLFFLNYFEFIAVGVRHGDLDEDLMRGSIRGFVQRLHDCGAELIKVHAPAKNSRTFEHLRWLRARWDDKSWARQTEFMLVLATYVLAFLACAYFTPKALNGLTSKQIEAATKTEPKLAPPVVKEVAAPRANAASSAASGGR
jgi:hypothetical protein